MRWVYRTAVGLVVAAVVIVGGALAWLSTVDLNDYKSEISEQVTAAVGRAFSIRGEARMRFSLTPSIGLSDVRLANAPGGSQPEMLLVKEAIVRFEVLPLFTGNLKVKDLVIDGASLLLETNAQGVGNWVFDTGEPTSPASPDQATSLPLLLEKVTARDLKIVFNDRAAARRWETRIQRLDGTVEDKSGRVDLSASGEVAGAPINVDAHIGSVFALLGSVRKTTFDARIEALKASVEIGGTFDSAAPQTLGPVAASLSGAEIADTIAALRTLAPGLDVPSLPKLGAFRLAAALRSGPKGLAAQDVDLSIGGAGIVALRATGSVANLLAASGFDMSISASGNELSRTVDLARPYVRGAAIPSVSDLGPYSVSLRLSGSAEAPGLDDVRVAVGKMERVRISAEGRIANVVDATGIDLDVAVSGSEIGNALRLASEYVPRLKEFSVAALGPFEASAKLRGSWTDFAVENLKGRFGTVKSARLTVDGGLLHLPAAPKLAASVEFSGDELSRPLELARSFVPSLEVPAAAPLGPFFVSAHLAGTPDALALDKLRLTVGNDGKVRVSVKGEIADVRHLARYRIPVEVRWTKPDTAIAALLPIAPQIPPFVVSTIVADRNGRVVADNLKVETQGASIAGRVSVSFAGAKPSVEAMLKSDSIELQRLIGPMPSKTGKGGKAETGSAPGTRLIPDTPLPLAELSAANVDAAIDVRRLSLTPRRTWSAIAVKLTLRDGKADLRLLNARSGTGQASASLQVDSSKRDPEASLSVDAKNLLLDDLLALSGNGGLVSDAKASVSVSLHGRGATPRQIAGTLNGTVQVDVGPGRLNNRVLDVVSGDIAQQLIGAVTGKSRGGDSSRLECGVIRTWAIDGRVSSPNAIALETDEVGLIAGGTIDLKTERIDLGFRTEPKKGLRLGLGQTLSRAARLRGTLAAPKVGVDEVGMATSAASVGAAVATGGISLLAESVIRRTAKTQDTCRIARAATLNDAKSAGDSPLAPINTVGKGIRNAAESGADTAKKGLESGTKGVTSVVKGAARGVVGGAEKAGDAIGTGLRNLFGNGRK